MHDGEAFDGVALAVDEVVVDLEASRRMSSRRGGWGEGVSQGGGWGRQLGTQGIIMEQVGDCGQGEMKVTVKSPWVPSTQETS